MIDDDPAENERCKLAALTITRAIGRLVAGSREIRALQAEAQEHGYRVEIVVGATVRTPREGVHRPRQTRRAMSARITRADRRLVKKWGIRL